MTRGQREKNRTGRQLTDISDQQSSDPLHGITLEMMLNQLVEHHGWEKLGQIIKIRCFNNDPSIRSSLQFLRKTPWARTKVEALFLKYGRNAVKKPKGGQDVRRGQPGK